MVGGKWLRGRGHNCVVVAVEPRSRKTVEQPDVIGWKPSGWSVLVEVKVQRKDFLGEKRKPHRRGKKAAGAMGQERWYLTTPGVILTVKEVPRGWGWAELVNGKVYRRKDAAGYGGREVVRPGRMRWEMGVALSLIQRLGQEGREGVWVGRESCVACLAEKRVPCPCGGCTVTTVVSCCPRCDPKKSKAELAKRGVRVCARYLRRKG